MARPIWFTAASIRSSERCVGSGTIDGVASNGAAKRGEEVYRTKLPAVVVHNLRLKRAMCLSRPTSEPGKLPYARSKGRTDEARGKDACHDRLLGLIVVVARLSVALVSVAVWG